MTDLLTQEQWQDLAQNLTFRTQAFINGRFVNSASGKTFTSVSPIDGRKLADVADCDSEDVQHAVTAARKAFEAGHWAAAKPSYRKAVLVKFSQLVREHAQELALLETLDMGKPIADSLTIDMPSAANCLAWSGEAIDKWYGEVAPTGPTELGMITREPLGVVAAIVPWNFPMLMACWKLGPALATGNSVILKPSEKSPLSALRLAELAAEAGVPDGVFNVLPGYGHTAGEPLAVHMDVDGLGFTGSTAVGKRLLSLAATSNMKRAYTECGGKSANVVFPDAPDLDEAAKAAAVAIFFNQGEVCTAGSRLIVHQDIADDFIAKVAQAANSMQPGHPLNPATTLGAMVDSAQMQRVLDYIETGQREGARLRCGGSRALTETGGFYIAPTIFDSVRPEMTIAREEIFGPVLSCLTFQTEEEALAIANNTDYGLAAAVWTSNLGRAHRVARKLRAGSVWVNYYDAGDMTAPFGGFKQSGNGRDKSLHAFEKYTEVKATWINLNG